MSKTLIGNYIQFASHLLMLFGFREISQGEADALVIVIAFIGEVAGFLVTHLARIKRGDVTVLGVRK